ncbi:hypothetical protein [Nibrella saemangeumensis]
MKQNKDFRYQLEKRVSQHSCPKCGQNREYTNYVDTYTGELLPEEYGLCNCGYILSPYFKTSSVKSYAEKVWEENKIPTKFFAKAYQLKQEGSGASEIIVHLQKYEGANFEQAEYVADYVFGKMRKTGEKS